jgi:hypothetical protein
MAGKIVKVQYMGKKEKLELVVPNLTQIYTFEKDNDYTVKMDYDDAAYLLRAYPGVFKVVSGKVEEKDINPPPPPPEKSKYYPSAKLIKMKQAELEAYAKEIGLKVPKGHPRAAIIKLINEKAAKKDEVDAAGDPAVDYKEPDGSPATGPAV